MWQNHGKSSTHGACPHALFAPRQSEVPVGRVAVYEGCVIASLERT
jgi:hypothetical protein